MIKKIFRYILFIPRLPVLGLIKIYQKTISFDHGILKFMFPRGYCRFYPTCSEYGFQIIKKRGLTRGIFKTVWRVLRCNPWSKGGVDLP
ncbi:MAG: membrane protein insertion efficiency factor YidD [Candidatus Magasanikbacteria bacterium CG10_big_fil_rev_8_21_14_0_10_40_10]|uniref:Putative membrane protein insertion efficiency factor n=1 Tax=Candidatus Magasanikbacteria bacterium CG10_big_fil_rev_8_21_14_0_10_40_10 TaxID=1974648 RepID=A0A2M6W345_9BACT|nr:MAG: membrane protein insertion efficiency factor YidD [Candidatus Magasanikbacteria bacterium CG10_big_fil_rev_8_21_14_0_10_40_10]